MINIKSKFRDNEKDKKDESQPNDDHTKEQLLRIITACLNKPLQELLEVGWQILRLRAQASKQLE